MKKHFIQIALGLALALVLLGHVARVYQIPLLNTLDAFVYDARLRLTMDGGYDERIVILDVDERSLSEIGRWPWSRNRMAVLVNKLFDDYGVAILGIDVILAESDPSSGLATLESVARSSLRYNAGFHSVMKRLRGSLDYDKQFANALRGRPVVLAYSFTNHDNAHKSGQLPDAAVSDGTFAGKKTAFTSWNGYGANLPVFQNAAASAGHINTLTDFDGVTRRVPMLVEYQGRYYESFSLALARVSVGQPLIVAGNFGGGPLSGHDHGVLEALDLFSPQGTVQIPIDEQSGSLIPFRGLQGSFRYVSAADALTGRLGKEELKGKIVLMGTSAPGLVDLRATPVGTSYPGVEIHANMLAGVLDGAIKGKPAYLTGAEALLFSLCALALALLLPVLSPIRATLLALCILLAVVGLNFYLWVAGLAMPLAATVVAIVGLYGPNMSWGYFSVSRSKRQFAELFGQYVPPELVDKMVLDPERYSMEGKNEELAVLFSDVRGFTSISEGLDPKELTHLMNAYLGAMTHVIRRNRGTLDKYIGDAIMAFWGAPVADAQYARHAVLAALEMQQELRKLDRSFIDRGWPVLQIGIGINTGTMTVGDMGSPVRKSYTVMGDAVNLGSRLEGLTKHYGVGIIVSDTTMALVTDMAYRELDRVRVKGKDEPVSIYEPLGIAAQLGTAVRHELHHWDLALSHYRAGNLDQSELQLRNLLELNSECCLYRLYLERVTHRRANSPGDGWDGVTAFETK